MERDLNQLTRVASQGDVSGVHEALERGSAVGDEDPSEMEGTAAGVALDDPHTEEAWSEPYGSEVEGPLFYGADDDDYYEEEEDDDDDDDDEDDSYDDDDDDDLDDDFDDDDDDDFEDEEV